MANWYDENASLDYPFITNQTVSSLPKSEIADCHFFITNPQSESIKVFLHEFTNNNGVGTYVFKAKDGNTIRTITFTVTKTQDWQCVWNTTNPEFYGFIVVTGTGVS